MAEFKKKADILELLEGYINDQTQEDGLIATVNAETGKIEVEDIGIFHDEADDDDPSDSEYWVITVNRVKKV